ncbi:tripartite tricarboxylate transporter TctB family protein [Thalassospiraceae bacterium LMO-JJ14]|nr:tripartite tricarboxylate transporter TctB family protein [Thalassospiraceae bacterium LMO-JJ14]
MDTDKRKHAINELMTVKAARTKDIILALVLIAVGLYGGISVLSTKATGFVDDQTMDHTTLPSLWGFFLAGLTALWLVQLVIELRTVNTSLGVLDHRANVFSIDRMFPELSKTLIGRMIAAVISIAVYAVLFEEMPFALITGVFLFVMLLVFGRPLHWKTGVLALGGCLVFHLMFVTFLQLPL